MPDRARLAGGLNDWRARLEPLPATSLPGGVVVHSAGGRTERRRGLAGLDALPADRALHLQPCRAVHTIGMRFALDLVWLDASGAVVRVDRAVPPWRHRVCRRARSVVKLRRIRRAAACLWLYFGARYPANIAPYQRSVLLDASPHNIC